MHTLRSRLALVLLLCFARVLVPDAWVLALHHHQHTVDTPTEAGTNERKAAVSAAHQHCEVDHFYDAAFQLPMPVVVPVRLVGYQAARSRPLVSVWTQAPAIAADSRGPPC